MKRCETARLATTLALFSGSSMGIGLLCLFGDSMFGLLAWFVISLAMWIQSNRLIDQVLSATGGGTTDGVRPPRPSTPLR